MEYGNLTIESALDDFLRHCRYERKLDEKTISAYRVDLKQFASSFGLNACICDISRDYLKAWLMGLEAYKPRTIKRKVASVKVFLHYLEEDHEAFESPFRRMQVRIKQPVSLPKVMTSCELKRILGYLEHKVSDSGHNWQCVRNRAVIELLFGTGMRIGELCVLRNKDVDLNEGRVRIHGKGNRERIVDIGPKLTLEALREWVTERRTSGEPEEWFFTNRLGNVLTPQSVRALVHQLCRQCSIRKNVTPHTFRHTFASMLLEEDVDVAYIQNILGHSSIATTQIYLHVNPFRQREILLRHHPRGRL